MPPAVRFNRDAVVEAACQLIRRDGPSALNARAVAKELGGSTQPIFRLFSGMDELRSAVIQHVSDAFLADMHRCMDASDTPYLAMSMSYLTFAKNSPQLFKLLFMRDRVTDGCYRREQEAYAALYAKIAHSMGITVEQAEALYASTWIYTHGLAVSIATKYLPCLSIDEMAEMLTENCLAAAHHLKLDIRCC